MASFPLFHGACFPAWTVALHFLDGRPRSDSILRNMLSRLLEVGRRCELMNGPYDELKVLDEAVGSKTKESDGCGAVRPVQVVRD